MSRLIKAEIYKLLKNKGFRVLCAVAVALSIVLIAMQFIATEEFFLNSLGDMQEEQKMIMLEEIKKFSNSEEVKITTGQLGFNTANTVKDIFNIKPIEMFHMSFGSSVLDVFVAILVALMFASEYSKGTIKNTLAYGKKRSHFYIAKFIGIVLGTVIIMAILTLLTTIVSTLIKGWGQPFEVAQLIDMVKTFLGTTIVYSSVIALVMIISALVKSKGAVIGISLPLFVLVPNIIGGFYGRFQWFDKLYEITPYYNAIMVTAINSTTQQFTKAIITSGIVFIITLITGILIFQKQDIK